MEFIDYSNSAISVIAPAVAIGLAILTRKVLPSLMAGILTGVLLLTDFAPGAALAYLGKGIGGVFWADGAINKGSVFILLFLILLGVMTSLIALAGGTKAFGDWARQRIKTPGGSRLLTVCLGVIIFIDDYFNALAVGSISRPLTDRHGVSRAQLAYLIDSTSAPVCVITPISSWGAYIIALVGSVLVAHGVTDTTAFSAFVQIIPMNFYAIFALLMVLAVAWLGLEVGPMKQHMLNAKQGQLFDPSRGTPPGAQELVGSSKGKVRDLLVPVLVLTAATVVFMIWTGAEALAAEQLPFSVIAAFEHTDVATSLVYGSGCGMLATLIMLGRHGLPLMDCLRAAIAGAKDMLPAIYILVCAWVLVGVISDLSTGKYLASLVQDSISPAMLPVLMFAVAGIMAFATGTSWGTFGVMLPIAGDMAAGTEIAMLLPMLGAVLAGSVFGDHCSPISDTTIMSSTGASCHHIDHVITQLPYALAVALISVCGYLVIGWTGSVMTGLTVGAALFVGIVALFRYLSQDSRLPSGVAEA